MSLLIRQLHSVDLYQIIDYPNYTTHSSYRYSYIFHLSHPVLQKRMRFRMPQCIMICNSCKYLKIRYVLCTVLLASDQLEAGVMLLLMLSVLITNGQLQCYYEDPKRGALQVLFPVSCKSTSENPTLNIYLSGILLTQKYIRIMVCNSTENGNCASI